MKRFHQHLWLGVFLLGGLIGMTWNGMAGCGLMILGLVLFGLPILVEDLRGDGGYWQTRSEADDNLRSITGDLTPAETRDAIEQERQTYNDNQAATWHTGVDGYRDYDGNWVQE